MNYKTLLLILFLFNFSNASFQEIRIGKIDAYYQDKISEGELRRIIDEIEETLEIQLGVNVFDYSQSGKPIDILYVPASKLEQRINRKIEKLYIKRTRIEKKGIDFSKKENEIDIFKKEIEAKNTVLNQKVKRYNDYIKEQNRNKVKTKKEYNSIQKEVKSRQLKLNIAIKKFKKDQARFKRLVLSYNNKGFSYNNSIREFMRLKKEVETMSRKFKKVKGVTIEAQEITLKTYTKNGKRVKERSINQIMNKIEIYGFDSLDELKAILAHEIVHLVGIPHINVKGALMNPILQKTQIEKFLLTEEDITNFNNYF